MELTVALEGGMYEWPMLLSASWIVSLDAHVDTNEEIVEVKTQTQAIGCRQLLVEAVEAKHTARLVFVVANGPNVAHVDKRRKFDYPEQF